jgi:hypothetical protein
MVGGAIAGGAGSFLNSVVTQRLDTGLINWAQAGISAGTGTLFGGLGGALLGEFGIGLSAGGRYAFDAAGGAALGVGQDWFEGVYRAEVCH